MCKYLLSINCCHQPFAVADYSIIVLISHVQEGIDLTLVEVVAVDHAVSLYQLGFVKLTTAVFVEQVEGVLKLLSLFLSHKVLDHETEGGLLNLVTRVKLPEVVKSTMKLLFVLWIVFYQSILEPLMLKSFLRTKSFKRIALQESGNQVLGLVRDLVPCISS